MVSVDSLDLSVDLAAPAERVFDVLADFAAFLDWNAYEGARIEIEGEGPGLQPGGRHSDRDA